MKRIILLAAFICLAIYLSAQFPFNIGVKGGITTARLYTNMSDYNQDNILGYYYGAFARLKFKRIFFQPEVYFIRKGGTLTYDNGGKTEENKVKLNNLDIPLLLGIKLIDTKPAKLSFIVGPVASFVTNKSITYREDGQPADGGFLEDDIKGANWGFQIGGAFDLFFLTFDVRYETGLNNILHSDIDVLRANLFLIGVGIKFL